MMMSQVREGTVGARSSYQNTKCIFMFFYLLRSFCLSECLTKQLFKKAEKPVSYKTSIMAIKKDDTISG